MDLEKLETIINEFSQQRDWDQFHSPKNLSMALSVEVSELVEIFQWLSEEESYNLEDKHKEHLKEEVADIAVYLLRICFSYNINLEEAILEKMEKNRKKYPVGKLQGESKKFKTKS